MFERKGTSVATHSPLPCCIVTLKSFSSVLSNTKVGNKKNEAVYDYLSNPINASKIKDLVDADLDKESIRKQDNSLGLIIILISYLVGLSITYLLQHSNIAMLQRQLQVYKRIQFRNSIVPMMFLSIFAGIAGIIIGMMSSYKLGMNFNDSFMLILSIIAILIIFTYGTNILLSKLKSFGFMLCVVILLLYILSSNQLLEDNMNFARKIADRILFLDKGVIAFDGLVDEFFNSQNERIKSFISAMDI